MAAANEAATMASGIAIMGVLYDSHGGAGDAGGLLPGTEQCLRQDRRPLRHPLPRRRNSSIPYAARQGRLMHPLILGKVLVLLLLANGTPVIAKRILGAR